MPGHSARVGSAAAPEARFIEAILRELASWQSDDVPLQLHPGDVGWHRRYGRDATAAALRAWRCDGRLVAVGLIDGPVLRLTTTPSVRQDHDLARRIVDDLPEVLPAGRVAVEAPTGALVHELLAAAGWLEDEPWVPLSRDLREPVWQPSLRVEVVGPSRAAAWAEVVRASFGSAESALERLRTSPAIAGAHCLLGHDDEDNAVAAVTVWTAGVGRPGLLEPMGAHPDHRGHGYGTAICVAAAAALRELGSSSAQVCTPAANVGAVATYRAAGYEPLPLRRDRYREG